MITPEEPINLHGANDLLYLVDLVPNDLDSTHIPDMYTHLHEQISNRLDFLESIITATRGPIIIDTKLIEEGFNNPKNYEIDPEVKELRQNALEELIKGNMALAANPSSSYDLRELKGKGYSVMGELLGKEFLSYKELAQTCAEICDIRFVESVTVYEAKEGDNRKIHAFLPHMNAILLLTKQLNGNLNLGTNSSLTSRTMGQLFGHMNNIIRLERPE